LSPLPPRIEILSLINSDFSYWTNELTHLQEFQEKYAEFDEVTYKMHFPIFADVSKDEKVSCGV